MERKRKLKLNKRHMSQLAFALFSILFSLYFLVYTSPLYLFAFVLGCVLIWLDYFDND